MINTSAISNTYANASAIKPHPYATGNQANGALLVKQKNCEGCHATKRNPFYNQRNTPIATPQQLLTQVMRCGNELKLELFPEDELDIARYLDLEYYRFEQIKTINK